MSGPAIEASPEQGEASPTRSAPERSRLAHLDVGRGIAILLVVIFHAYRGFLNAGTAGAGSLWPLLDYSVYIFHMAFFFVASGYWVPRALKKGRTAYLRDKLATTWWPAVLWSLIYIVINNVMAAYVNKPVPIDGLWRILFFPAMHFWFLGALFLFFLCMAVTRNISFWLLAAVVAAGLVDVFPMRETFARYCHFGIFFIAGVILSTNRSQMTGKGWPMALFVLGVTIWLGFEKGIDLYSGWLVPGGFAGIILLLALARAIAGHGVGRVLGWIGQRSMPIYVLHILPMSASRVVLHRIAPDLNLDLRILIVSASGLVFSLIGYAIAARLNLLAITGFGKDSSRSVQSA
ncbi:MAG: acyltransferase [Sphingobium sp.]|uniref:acyltransferase family protein n=1 Tax=Sphingobium sp. TaxID=1912891 RepID=UPI001A339400|nr:acyltransferase [Sphingobium sp.]MBJ7443377.1 acyltransferase [Sphingobium sp.]